MEDQNVNSQDNKEESNEENITPIAIATEENQELIDENNTIANSVATKEINQDISSIKVDSTKEAEHIYSLISSAIPPKDGFRKNISKRDFALWVIPILAINKIRRFTSINASAVIKPYEHTKSEPYVIKGNETVYTNTKNVFQGKEKMRFFGFRFMSIWVFPMAVTGAFMEFLFVGPLKGTNPFG